MSRDSSLCVMWPLTLKSWFHCGLCDSKKINPLKRLKFLRALYWDHSHPLHLLRCQSDQIPTHHKVGQRPHVGQSGTLMHWHKVFAHSIVIKTYQILSILFEDSQVLSHKETLSMNFFHYFTVPLKTLIMYLNRTGSQLFNFSLICFERFCLRCSSR